VGPDTWSDKLYQIYQSNQNKRKSADLNIGVTFSNAVEIRVDGPYGNVSSFFFNNYRVLIFICGGIGVTPIMSILKYLYKQAREYKTHVLRVYFLWATKNPLHLEWLADFLNAVKNFPPKFELETQFHVTRNSSSQNLVNDSTPLLSSHNRHLSTSSTSSVGSLSSLEKKDNYYMGRPGFTDYFRKIYYKHINDQDNINDDEVKIALKKEKHFGVLICGPKEMEKDVQKACYRMNSNPDVNVTFDFHSQTFLL